MRRGVAAILAAIAVAACQPARDQRLPGASIVPQPRRAVAARACGDDVTFGSDTSPDLTLSYSYDALGRLVGEIGVYTASGGEETIAIAYDHLGHETHELDSFPGSDGSIELRVDFDTLGDLVDYVEVDGTQSPPQTQDYQNSMFTATGQPLVEVVAVTAEPTATYALVYDAWSRLVATTMVGGATTTYTYDDDGRMVTIDTGSGAFTGEIAYDADDNELYEQWGGSDPAAVASRTSYSYDGEQLTGIVYEQGTPLAVLETDTFRFCAP